MSTEHAHYPLMPSTDPWTPRVEQPLKSALKAKWGQEPEFTCYSYADRVHFNEKRADVREIGRRGRGRMRRGAESEALIFITHTNTHPPK